jgi:hypothetical protein
MDEWGPGKAFHCSAADCGGEVNLYLRAKIGFCNCATGVADDDELDRISDYHLIRGAITPLGPGQPIKIGWMAGRSRNFALRGARASGRSAVFVGFNDHCDAIVATATVTHDEPNLIADSIIEFLSSQPVLHWAEAALGL